MVAYIFALKILFGPFRTYRSCTVVTIEEIRRIEENLFRVLRLVLKVSAVEEGGSFSPAMVGHEIYLYVSEGMV